MFVNLVNCLVVMFWVNVHQREQIILGISTVFKGLGIKVTIYSSQTPLHLMKMDFNSTPPGFHYEIKVFFFH